jgi:GntR family transcriptional regulator/MocR family aminotransferase
LGGRVSRVRSGLPLPLALDRGGGAPPIHRQLYDWFRQAILAGQLRAGERVPSTRTLAAELGVSRAPVLSAFEQLLAEGYFEAAVGSGTCVAAAIPEEATAPSTAAAKSKVAAREAARPLPIGAFRASLPALDRFPARVWSRLVARHVRSPPLAAMDYGESMGHPRLREALADYLRTSRAVRCDASQIIIVPGSMHGLQLAARVLLSPGDAVWVEEPGYPGARRTLVMAGAQIAPVPVDDEGLLVEQGLRRCAGARMAYVTPSHHYPLGATMSAGRRMQLLAWAARTGAWIIEDDYDSEYRFAGRPVAALQGLDANQRTIYLGAFSKVMFPALRVAYLVIPRDLVPAFRSAHEAGGGSCPGFVQAALADFIAGGHFARHIRRMRMLYLERRNALVDEIGRQIGPGLEVVGAEAGLHLTGLLPPGMDDAAIAGRAVEAGAYTFPLSSCCLEPPARGGLVLGYASADPAQIRDGVGRIAEAIRAQA